MPKIKKVIIVEDEKDLAEMYKEKLISQGFRVNIITDSRKAMTKIKQGADMVLLDILMPGLNGFELLKKIKSDKNICEIPVVVLTNIGSESADKDRNLALSLGAVDYMVKSLNTPLDVLNKINKILSSINK
ncbi:MAG: response regulator [Patescibacteria group bacterium]|jgi:two-component system alkaline phosphatase synthesis response regulator PhoP